MALGQRGSGLRWFLRHLNAQIDVFADQGPRDHEAVHTLGRADDIAQPVARFNVHGQGTGAVLKIKIQKKCFLLHFMCQDPSCGLTAKVLAYAAAHADKDDVLLFRASPAGIATAA